MFTADEEVLLLWSLEKTNQPYRLRSFNDRSTPSIEKNEKITCASLHPHHESLFSHGTNRGRLSIVDSRVSIACPKIL